MWTVRKASAAARRRLRSLAVALVVVLALSVVVLGYLATTAPARFVSSSPGAGAMLDAAPSSVSLRFSRPLDPGDSHAAVGTAAGRAVVAGAPTVDGETIVQPVAIERGGAYVVVYHVAFADGAELSGTLRFSVSGGDTVPRAAARPPAGSEQGGGGHDHGTFDPVTLTILGADAAVTAAVLVMLWLRRRRRRQSPVDMQRL